MKHSIIITWILKVLNYLIPKEKNRIVFLPHLNGKADCYDILNFHSDNVLCLFNYIIRCNDYNDYHLVLFYYDSLKLNEYKTYVNDINPVIKVTFVPYSEKNVVKILLRSHKCFTDQAYYNFRFKIKKQKFICLGYFTPFKRDYLWEGPRLGYVSHDYFMDEFKRHNESFDYYVTTSDISSRVLSIDTGISYYKFVPFGMPRNEMFLHPNHDCLLFLKKYLNLSCDHLIMYTPTFRDYEEPGDANILGYKTSLVDVERILEDNNAILIAKLHPKKKFVKDVDGKSSRIINYNNLPSNFSLYDYLSIADILITDYTSTYFDFLYADKPVIFNNYDFEKYSKIRGFSYNPIKPYCSGYIVDSYKSLCDAISESLVKDVFKVQRNIIHGIMNTASGENVCSVICSNFLK